MTTSQRKAGLAPLLILIVILPLLPLWTAAHELPASAEAVPGLHHEPIQPLLAPTAVHAGKAGLGERLFHEPRLSRGNDMACTSCHDLNDNGAGHQAFSTGRDGVPLDVNTPTVFNSSLNYRQFWDGRAGSLEEQIDFVVSSSKEFATSWPEIISRLRQDKSYAGDFDRLYPDGITAANVRDAIATFERTLVTVNSSFDRFLLGDADAISPQAREGYRLFKKYGCTACHQGSNVGGNLYMKFGIFGDHLAGDGKGTPADLGRFNITGKEADRYVFRVPGLRLVALTAPYFHNGSAETLEQAVKIMAEHQLGRAIPDRDIACIVAFLETLPGEYRKRRPGTTERPQSRQEPR